MLFSQDQQQPFIAVPCQEMDVDKLKLLSKSLVQDIKSFKSSDAENFLDQLLSLQRSFHEGLAIINTLINTTRPVNSLPPELLGHIFALTPERLPYDVEAPTPGHWPFMQTTVEDLHALPKVCRYWRELSLAMPTLWSTISSTQDYDRRDDSKYLRHSIYLRDRPSLELNVDFHKVGSPTPNPRIEEFLLRNSSRIRELYYCDSLSTSELPQLLRSFNANALEKCLLETCVLDSGSQDGRAFHPLFSEGGPRLRALCLSAFSVLPENGFPALSCLVLSVDVDTEVSWSLWDLLKFIAGCTMLEEVSVCDVRFATPTPSHNPHAISTPLSLPRLRYLCFQYLPNRKEEDVNTIDFLLSNMVIPSDCHLYLTVLGNAGTDVNCRVFNSVRRHIPGKNCISHLVLWLPDTRKPDDIGLQLVFAQGSLRLRFIASPNTHALDVDGLSRFFHAYPDIFAPTTELRIHYDDRESVHTKWARLLKDLENTLPAIIPNVKLMSMVAPPGSRRTGPSLQICLQLLPASNGSRPPTTLGMEPALYPALETLWVTLPDLEENMETHTLVAQLKALRAVLSTRAALGFPVRRIIVTYVRSSSSTPNTPREIDDRAVRDLLALDDIVNEVVLMGIPPHEDPSEADWLVWYPEKYELPADVRRDWPLWEQSC